MLFTPSRKRTFASARMVLPCFLLRFANKVLTERTKFVQHTPGLSTVVHRHHPSVTISEHDAFSDLRG